MALNPNIALAVKGPEFADPMAMYGRIAAIQGAQSQNQLAQLQMQQATREQESTNALNQAYASAYNPQTGDIDANKLRQTIASLGQGSKLPGIEKSLRETETAKLNQQKVQGEVFDSAMTRSRQFLEGIDPTSPDAGAQIAAWHEGNHRDKVLGPLLASRGVNVEDQRAKIAQVVTQGPQAVADYLNQAKLGTAKFTELSKPTYVERSNGREKWVEQRSGLGGPPAEVPGSRVVVEMSPYQEGTLNKPTVVQRNNGTEQWMERVSPQGGPGVEVDGTRVKMNMTPGQAAANRIAGGQLKVAQDRLANQDQSVTYHTDSNGNIVALPSKLPAGQVPVARTAVAPGAGGQPLAGKPSEAVTKELSSISQQRSIVKGALEALDKTPSAFGLGRGLAGETIGGRLSSDAEVQARAYLFNVVSGVIKERAGTAQSAGEAETLSRFLPQPTDNADIIRGKMKAFDKYLTDKESGVKPGKTGATTSPVAPSPISGTALPPGFQLDK